MFAESKFKEQIIKEGVVRKRCGVEISERGEQGDEGVVHAI